MNPLVEKYMKNKFGENYDQKNEQAYNEQLDRSNTGSLISNIGDVIAGNKVGSNNKFFQDQNALVKENTIDKADKAKKDFASDYDLDEKMQSNERNKAQLALDDDINSSESQIAQSAAIKMGMKPEQAKLLTATKFKSISPTMTKIYEIEQKKLDRQDARALRTEQFNEKKKAQQIKDQELSAQESKQLGLYKSGKLAEKMYQDAVSTPDDYNPTNIGQWIDNSNWEITNAFRNPKARAAQAAMSSWVESYLRDASGAAIPPSERMSYAKDFFPMPGDDENVVENKALLREQKMQNARIAAGPKARDVQTVQNPEDLAALKWANENPNDPRAEKILKKLNNVGNL